MVLLLSDAVEAGVISNGRLLHGRLGNAGQLGHVVVEPDGLAVRLRRHRVPDGVRVVVGDRGGDEPAAAAGAGVGHRADRR